MSKITLNDPNGGEVFRIALENGSPHETIFIYPSAHTKNEHIHILVPDQTFEAIYRGTKDLLKYSSNISEGEEI